MIAKQSDRNGLRQVPADSPGQNGNGSLYEVDVVAVHGLGGDLYKTWAFERDTGHNDEIFWLSHLLPRDLPGARIFTFGYPSQWSSSYSVAGVKDYARSLLQALQQLPEKVVCETLILTVSADLSGEHISPYCLPLSQSGWHSRKAGLLRRLFC